MCNVHCTLKSNDTLMSGIIAKSSWFTKHFLEIKASNLNLNTHAFTHLTIQLYSLTHRTKNSASHGFHRIYGWALHRWMHSSTLYRHGSGKLSLMYILSVWLWFRSVHSNFSIISMLKHLCGKSRNGKRTTSTLQPHDIFFWYVSSIIKQERYFFVGGFDKI